MRRCFSVCRPACPEQVEGSVVCGLLMSSVSTSAPAKVILFGEHAAVYGYPAIAIPITQIVATATVEPREDGLAKLVLGELNRTLNLADASEDEHPLVAAIEVVKTFLEITTLPPLTITLNSNIPIAAGLGSGAASAAAIIRSLLRYLSNEPTPELVSALTYQVEKRFHGTPSGIDNSVVSYAQPIYFVRKQPTNLIEPFHVAKPLQLLIADSGERSSTKAVVSDVRQLWQTQMARYESYFARCGHLSDAGRKALEQGNLSKLGLLMQENQEILDAIGVSSAELNTLCHAAIKAGAMGAKLSGAGRGGNMIALVSAETLPPVTAALINAGAKNIITTTLETN